MQIKERLIVPSLNGSGTAPRSRPQGTAKEELL